MRKLGTILLLSLLMVACSERNAGNSTAQDVEAPIAQALREALEPKTRIPQRRSQSAMDGALQELYAQRGYRPLWNDAAAYSALMTRGFGALEAEGLRPQDYIDPRWAQRLSQVYGDGVSAKERAAFDLETTRRYLRALSHVAYGKVNPASIGTQWETAPTAVNQRLSLAWAALAAQTGAVAGAFAQAQPQDAAYQRMRTMLAQPGLSAGQRAQLRVNLERSRWLHQDLPASYVLVDIAGYQLHYHRPDGEVWSSKVVVGKPYRKTPTFRSEIDQLTVHPTWTVPPTIFKNDIAPKARADAEGTLRQKHLRAIDGQGNDVPLSSIDWNDPSSVILRQAPGPQNPLGKIKISFDNPYQVYLHDTSNPERFEDDERANSSGCIRVQNALELAQLLLQDSQTQVDLQQQVDAGKTRGIKLNRTVPVLLYYSTVDVTPQGEVVFKDDIYGRDPVLLSALDA